MHSACRHWRSEDHVSDQCIGPSATRSKFAYDAHKGYWAHHNSSRTECGSEDTVMKRTIFAVVSLPRSGQHGCRRR